MTLEKFLADVLSQRIRIEGIGSGDVRIYTRNGHENLAMRIYPEGKNAEVFLDDDLEELEHALKEEYKGFPEIKKIVSYLNDQDYHIIF